MKPVSPELLQNLSQRIPINIGQPSRGSPSSFDLEKWINDHGLDVGDPMAWNGGRRWVFDTCPWNSEHRNRSAFIVQFPNGAVAAGCHHNGCRDKDWHALRDLIEPGRRSQIPHEFTGALKKEFGEWDIPIPFHQFDLPPFPTDALPDWLRTFVEAEATATQTPVDLAAMLTLSIIGASCAKKVVVRIKEDYFEPVNIFTVTSLPSGSRKTSVFAAVTKPLADYERCDAKRANRENAKRRSTHKIKEAALKKLQEQAAGQSGKEQEQLAQQAQNLAAELAEAGGSLPTRLIADDCTPEKLATLLGDNGGRIAVLSAEGDVFELMAGRYSANKAPNFAVYLKGHAGDQLRIDRVGRAEFVNRPALTVGLAVQPDVIRELAQKPRFREHGLLARFLYSLPKNLLGSRNTNPPPVPEEVREAYHRNVLALLRLPLEIDDAGEAVAQVLTLAPDAWEALQQFDQWVEPRLSEFGELGAMTDWGGKLVGAVARIAGILHMASLAGVNAPWETPISRETVDCAVRIGMYLIPHVKAAFAEMGADPVVAKANRILRLIEHKKLVFFTRRDLHQAMKGTFTRVAELDPPLFLLVDLGYVRKREEITDGGPGRSPSPTYDVNPLWVSRDSQTMPKFADEN